jgi:hypothetical protein
MSVNSNQRHLKKLEKKNSVSKFYLFIAAVFDTGDLHIALINSFFSS